MPSFTIFKRVSLLHNNENKIQSNPLHFLYRGHITPDSQYIRERFVSSMKMIGTLGFI